MSDEPKKKEVKNKPKETEKADFSKSIVDLNSANFRNRDVQEWSKRTAAKQRGVRSTVSGLSGLGARVRAPRLVNRKKQVKK